MFFELLIALRYLKEGKTQTILILSGISIGIAVLIFLSSLISGLQKDLLNKTVGDSPHIIIKPQEDNTNFTSLFNKNFTSFMVSSINSKEKNIENYDRIVKEIGAVGGISAISSFADGNAFISKGKKTNPVFVRGIDIKNADRIYNFKSKITEGDYTLENNDIIIGKTIAEKLAISVGDTVKFKNAIGTEGFFRVVAFIDMKNEGLNERWVIMNFSKAQNFFGIKGKATSVEIKTENYFEAENISKKLSAIYNNLDIVSWQRSNKQLLSALQSQSGSTNIINIFVLLAVSLGISSVLAVSVMQKSRQIGILKAMGTTDFSIGIIFILQGGILGFLGSILGSLIGFVLIYLFTTFASSGGSLFKIELTFATVLLSVIIATVIGVLAAFFPARNSAKLNPIEVIRNG